MVGSFAAGPAYYRDAAVRGNSFVREYQLKYSDDSPVDLTGHTVRWRGVYGDYSISKTTADGSMSMTTPTNGTVNLTLTPDETRLIPNEENMKYELEMVVPSGTQQTVLCGDLVGKWGFNSD